MKKIETHINGLFIIENIIFNDERGMFVESWNKNKFEKENLESFFLQDNMSISKKNVIRGLHFQNEPYSQTKLVSVVKGKVLDIVVDIRKKSKTFGEYLAIELSDSNHRMLWIPTGFAHGFLTLEENTIFTYKCSRLYQEKHEYTIKWNDKEIGIKWGIKTPIISEKDKLGISLKQYKESNNLNG